MKSLNLPNKIDLNQIQSLFLKNQFIVFIIDKLKEIMELQNKIKLDDLEYTTKKKSVIISVDTLYLLFFSRDIHEGNV